MLVKVKQMQVSSSVKQLSCGSGSQQNSKNSNSTVDSNVQEAIDLSIENYRLRKRY